MALDEAGASALVAQRWGLHGEARSLGSHEDANFAITPADRPEQFVLKVTWASTSPPDVEAQALALAALAGAGLRFATPVVVPALDGSAAVAVGDELARLLTWVPGEPLATWRHLAPSVRRSLGAVAGATAAALADVAHPALDRTFPWDCRRAAAVVQEWSGAVADDGRRALALDVAARAARALEPLAAQLRVAPIHGDVTDLNVVARRGEDGRPEPCGLIDVGDLALGWVVAEAAVAACSAVAHAPHDPLPAVVDVVAGFHGACPLDEHELRALWWVLLGRAAVLAVAAEHQALLDPANEYVTSSIEREWRTLDALVAVAPPVAHEALRLGVGLGPSGDVADVAPPASVAMVDGPLGPVVDRSVTAVAPGPLELGAVGRHGEGRPGPLESTATVALGVEVAVGAGADVRGPVDGHVRAAGDDRVVLALDGLDLAITGLVPAGVLAVGSTVAAGALLGRAAGAASADADDDVAVLRLAVGAPGLAVPDAVAASVAPAWLAACADPSPLLGLAPGTAVAPRPDAAALQRRRRAVLAGVQAHYWAQPPAIERGLGATLWDTDGQAYLDAVNNVAVLGHSHPAVAEAVGRQLRLLNTNSRFHYEAIVAYAERLAALLPDPLDTVLLVNTGSEACDLALRLVRTATGADDVLAVRGAYHGWTMATDAVSTSLNDNPAALETRPPWVHLVEAPNTYRGRFAGPDAGVRYAADVDRALAELAAAGRRPAGMIVEPLAGNAGGIVLPDGYLAAAFDAVRAAGGLCIADEVQTGLGRLGEWFWAFESQGVRPDVVTVAKATGNGVPVGAVVTTRAIAEAFAAEGSFFSSVGGSPVGAVAGLAVLDAIEAEGLQANAASVGAHLRSRLEELVARHELCGAVHGLGLYLGLELVRDRGTLEPATAETWAICERARELGVVVQPTGDASNVLKIKPPLCLTTAEADRIADVLERTFAEGW